MTPTGKNARATLPVPNPTASYWQTSAPSRLAHHRSTAALPGEVDVVVVGSGITAAFCVRELLGAVKGLNVVVLEARGLCSGATGRNGGHLVPDVSGEREVKEWEVRGCEDVERVVREWGGECEYRRLEGVMAWWDRGLWEEVKKGVERDVGRSGGVGVRIVEDGEELKGLGLREGCVGAFVQGWAATLSPYRLITGLWEELVDKDAVNLQTDTAVTGLERDEGKERGWVVVTERGRVRAQHVVVATNGWTSRLLKRFTSVIVPTQGQMTALAPPKEWKDQGRLLNHDYGFHGLEGQDAVMSDYVVHRPWKDGGHFMSGGARQWAKGCGEGVSDDSYNDEEAVRHLRRLSERIDVGEAPELELAAAWTGVMGYSKDGCPWVGGMPGMPGVWVSAAYTGHGMPNAPGSGRHLARLVACDAQGGDWRARERQAVLQGEILPQFVLGEARLARHALPVGDRSSLASGAS